MPDPRRQVPRADTLLADPRLVTAQRSLGRDRVKRAVGAALDAVRDGTIAAGDALDDAVRRLPTGATSLRPVLNATGVVLHTNLGRAPLSGAAVEALRAAAGYTDVEFDLASGQRARRGAAAFAALLRRVPDAEDALMVNNGAAALLLACLTLAGDRELVVSRGELVEIGDGFRLPDLIESAGVRLREVGTTNRVTAADYAAAIGPQTGAILKVHPSNFRIEGFTRAVETRDLAPLGMPVIVDVGSGLLAPDPALPAEPDVTTTLRAGAAVVTCSGDKLLGGPQAGLALGAADVIERMRRHPMARALRVDKLTLAALEATLDGPPTPTALALAADPAELRARCEALAAQLADVAGESGDSDSDSDGDAAGGAVRQSDGAGGDAAGGVVRQSDGAGDGGGGGGGAVRQSDGARSGDAAGVEVVRSDGAVGGGGAPGVVLPGWALALPPECAERLRHGEPPVIARIERGRCLVDPRCVPAVDDPLLLGAIRAALAPASPP